jgi:hypothetical protein
MNRLARFQICYVESCDFRSGQMLKVPPGVAVPCSQGELHKSSANTSQPIHFLANSVIGPSFYISMPSEVTYTKVSSQQDSRSGMRTQFDDSGCWTAFRAHSYVLPKEMEQLHPAYNKNKLGNSTTYTNVQVYYTSNCTQYVDNGSIKGALAETAPAASSTWYTIGGCQLGYDVYCVLGGEQPKQCRMNV